jgi:hypothetical protein
MVAIRDAVILSHCKEKGFRTMAIERQGDPPIIYRALNAM